MADVPFALFVVAVGVWWQWAFGLFTTAYFHRPADLRHDVERAGLTVEALYGIEGPGWLFGDFEARWADAERRSALLQLAALLERVPDVAGCSAHLLVVARTPPS